jgi:phosphonate transport system substrate-binding protein
MREHFIPIVDYMSRKFNIKVNLIVSENYQELEELVEKGVVDIASFSPLAYVIAKERNPGLNPIASQIGSGTTKYSAYLLVRNDSNIHSLQDLKGKKIAFVDESSTSGYLYPYVILLDYGIDPETFFGEIVFTKDHLKSLQMLYEGKADVAATFSGAIRASRLKGLSTGSFRILMKTGRIPYDALCLRTGIEHTVADAIKKMFLNLSTRTEEGRSVLSKELEINGWIPADDARYDPVRDVLKKYREKVKK